MRNIIYPIEYLNIISNAIRRGLTKKSAKQLGIGGHIHHIIPKTVAPELSKEKYNMVFLSYEEHYTVHKILAEANPDDNIAYAWNCMRAKSETSKFFSEEDYSKSMELMSSKASENAKKQWEDFDFRNRMSGDNNPMRRKDIAEKNANARRGQKRPSVAGPNNPMYGVPKPEGAGAKPIALICKEHPEWGTFESQNDAERRTKELGCTGVSQKHLTTHLKHPEEKKSCGKDAEGNKLHWALA